MSDVKEFITEQEYLVAEPQREYKSEYRQGRTFAMAGANRKHNQIVFNIAGELRPQLKKRDCTAFVGDMRVKVAQANFYTYPDVSIVCGPASFMGPGEQTLMNPAVIMEVLSASTERYDRGEKFEAYKKLASLREYVLVSQEQVDVQRFTSQENGSWVMTELKSPESALELPPVGCRLALRELYDKVIW